MIGNLFTAQLGAISRLFIYSGLICCSIGSGASDTELEGIDQECASLLSLHGHLEQVLGDRAISWVRRQNDRTKWALKWSGLRNDELREGDERSLSRNPVNAQLISGYIYRLFTDDERFRGVLRRTSIEQYKSGTPNWETVLDVDAEAKRYGTDWYYQRLITRPGQTNAFVEFATDGTFFLNTYVEVDLKDPDVNLDKDHSFPFFEPYHHPTWISPNAFVLAVTAENKDGGNQTRAFVIWKRGKNFRDLSPITFERELKMEWVNTLYYHHLDSQYLLFILGLDKYSSKKFLLKSRQTEFQEIPLPESSEIEEVFEGKAIVRLREDWIFQNETYPMGSIVSVYLSKLISNEPAAVKIIYSPTESQSINQVMITKGSVFLEVLDNVIGHILEIRYRGARWKVHNKIRFSKLTHAKLEAADASGSHVLIRTTGFIGHRALYVYDATNGDLDKVETFKVPFNSSDYEVSQKFAVSSGGVRVPYFIINQRGMKLDGSNPTVLNGYGGFGLSRTPHYLGDEERYWLRRGGVYVVANIRGGGEFGPRWHQAGVREKRPQSFDDFIAVAEKLIADGVTSPEYLGAFGVSNGGLLVGAVAAKRPDLFAAVVCQNPVLDMLRYHKLCVLQNSEQWSVEYGSPEDPDTRKILAAYSPYHNLNQDRIPEILFLTARDDQIVHPGHARKMAQRMDDLGHSFLFYEAPVGSHDTFNDYVKGLKWNFLVKNLSVKD